MSFRDEILKEFSVKSAKRSKFAKGGPGKGNKSLAHKYNEIKMAKKKTAKERRIELADRSSESGSYRPPFVPGAGSSPRGGGGGGGSGFIPKSLDAYREYKYADSDEEADDAKFPDDEDFDRPSTLSRKSSTGSEISGGGGSHNTDASVRRRAHEEGYASLSTNPSTDTFKRGGITRKKKH